MNKQRIGILIAAGLGMLATFMPWLKAPVVGTINGAEWKGDGWITFFLFALTLVISLINDKSKSLKGWLLYCAIIPSIIAAAIGIWKINDINSMIGTLGIYTGGLPPAISIGFGLYLEVLAGISIPIIAFAIMGIDMHILSNNNKKKVAEENMKKCPFCAELIQKEAKVCRFCSSKFEAA